MEPTNTQIAEFATVQDMAKWAGMKGDHSDITSTVGSFFSMMGFEPDEHWRTLAMITEPDLKEILKSWEIDKPDGKVKANPRANCRSGVGGGCCEACGRHSASHGRPAGRGCSGRGSFGRGGREC